MRCESEDSITIMSRVLRGGIRIERVIGRTTDVREVAARAVSVKHFISSIEDLLCRPKRGPGLGGAGLACSRTREEKRKKKDGGVEWGMLRPPPK